MDSFEKMYSVKEAAFILGVSSDTVRRMIRRGQLKAWKIPGRENHRKRQHETYRVPHSELVRFMRQNAA